MADPSKGDSCLASNFFCELQLVLSLHHKMPRKYFSSYAVKALLSHRGGLSNFRGPRGGGLIERGAYWRGGLISKFKIKDISPW